MRTTANFDSHGISTGKDMQELYTTVDTLIMANIMRSLAVYKDKPIEQVNIQQWQSRVISDLTNINKRTELILRKAMREATRIVNSDINEAFTVAVAETERQVEELKAKGKKTPQEPQDRLRLQDNAEVRQAKRQALEALNQASNMALANSREIVLQSVNLLPMAALAGQTLHSVIDRVTAPIIDKGITAKVKVNGNELNIAGYASLVTRDTSTNAYLGVGSQARASYGLNLLIVSTHASSCPLCRPLQGKILFDDRYATPPSNNRYMTYSQAKEKGLHHFNCRHGVTPYLPGMEKPSIPKDTPETAAKKRLAYDIEQKQRVLQREIRNNKKKLDLSLTDAQKKKAREQIANKQARLRELKGYADKNNVPFYRQNWKEQTTFEFKTFKPELTRLIA